MTRFSEYLKKNETWRNVVVYLGGGWVLIEALNFITNKYGFSDKIVDVFLVLVIFGLPILLLFNYFHFNSKTFKFHKFEVIIYLLIIISSVFTGYLVVNRSDSTPLSENDLENGIAVLTFKNFSPDKNDNYFAAGICEAIRNNLGQLGSLKVISRNSIEKFQNDKLTTPEIASRLGVSYILDGSIQKDETKVRINVQLIDTKTDTQIWSEVYNRLFEDVLNIQSEIASDIANRLKITTHKAVTLKRMNNPESYDLYLKGLNKIRNNNGTTKDLEETLNYFDQVIKNEDHFAPAYLGKAEALLNYVYWGRASFEQLKSQCHELISKALELDKGNSRCYSALGAYYFLDLDFKLAKEYLNKAIETDPNNSDAYHWLSILFYVNNKFDKSIEILNKSISLDPINIFYKVNKISYYYYANKKEVALEMLDDLISETNDDHAVWFLSVFYADLQKYDEGISILAKRKIGTNTNWILGYIYGKTGNVVEAERILNYHLDKKKQTYVPSFMISVIYIGLGDKESAIEWLEKEFEEGPNFMCLYTIRTDPKLDPLRKDPRFISMLESIPYSDL